MDIEAAAHVNDLKKHVFYDLLHLAGRVFVLVRYSEHVILGNRGFTADEIENGIILVFNSRMHFQWDEYGITATLVFGTSPQKCFIPVDEITAIYSSELGAQLTVSSPSAKMQEIPTKSATDTKDSSESAGNVIKVDFIKKQKQNDTAKGKD
ncbi:MAG: hypothetical protein HQL09_01085 [Nitrospirae bacterium]|nr:hypothetical protein [Nitrospirota bacterium]